MAVSLTMMAGRVGSLIGNIMFPIFLEYGCIVAILCLTALGLGKFNYFNLNSSIFSSIKTN